MRQSTLYPRPMDVKQIVRWSNEGDEMFRDRFPRMAAMEALSSTIRRLDLPDVYEDMRRASLGTNRREGSVPSQELLRGLLNNLRIHGYIHPTGPVPDGRTRPPYDLVPLTFHQLRLVRMHASGMNSHEVADELGVDVDSVRKALRVARKEHKMTTTLQLAVHAYWSNWLPGKREENWLREQPHPIGTGWIYRTEGVAA